MSRYTKNNTINWKETFGFTGMFDFSCKKTDDSFIPGNKTNNILGRLYIFSENLLL